MASSTEALFLEAKNLEMQGLEKHKVALASASSLDEMLDEVYDSRSPKPIDYDNRRDLVRIFNVMAKEIYGNHNGFPIVETRDPPILPTFSALFKDGNDPEAVVKMVQNYLNYGRRNKESLAELFITLLVKLASVEQLWQKGLCVSLCEGFWISKAWDSGFHNIHVEDFIDQSQNVARAVGTLGFEKIHSSIHGSLHYLEAFSEGQILGTKLKELLFGRDTKSSVGDSVALNLDRSTTKLSVPNNSNQIKKIQLTEGLNGAENQPGVGNSVAINIDKSTPKLSVPNSSNQINKIQLTEDLKGAENQRKKQLVVQHGSQQTKKRHFTGLDETKGVKRWKGHIGDKRAGVQFREVIEEHLKPLPSIRWEGKEPEAKRREWQNFGENRGPLSTHFAPLKPLPSIHWEGQDPENIRREWQNFGENRGHLSTNFVPQPQNSIPLSHSLVSSTSRGPVMHPTISVPNFPSFQGLCNPVPPSVPPPPAGCLFSLLNSLGVDISHVQSTPAPILPSGPTHGQHTHHQPHSMQRILRR